jgi:hypothetical protein
MQSSLYIGDASQIADAVITAAKLAAGILPAGYPFGLVEAKTLTDVASADFAALGTHNTYVLFYSVHGTSEAGNNPLYLIFNADTTATNYQCQCILAGAATLFNSPYLGNVRTVASGQGGLMVGMLIFNRIPVTTHLPVAVVGAKYTDSEQGYIQGIVWDNAATVTRVRLMSTDAGNKITGKAALYYLNDLE